MKNELRNWESIRVQELDDAEYEAYMRIKRKAAGEFTRSAKAMHNERMNKQRSASKKKAKNRNKRRSQ